MNTELNKYSRRVTQDINQPGARAMLHAIGLDEADLSKPQIGIVSTGFEGNPCNMHLNVLAESVKAGVNSLNLLGLIFNTIGVSDVEEWLGDAGLHAVKTIHHPTHKFHCTVGVL